MDVRKLAMELVALYICNYDDKEINSDREEALPTSSLEKSFEKGGKVNIVCRLARPK
jgi:hypothetical protein